MKKKFWNDFVPKGFNKNVWSTYESVVKETRIVSVFVHSDSLNNEPLFFTDLEAEKSKIKELRDMVSGRAPSWLVDGNVSLVFLIRGEGRGTLWVPFIRTLIPFMRMPVSWSNYLQTSLNLSVNLTGCPAICWNIIYKCVCEGASGWG